MINFDQAYAGPEAKKLSADRDLMWPESWEGLAIRRDFPALDGPARLTAYKIGGYIAG
jgi:hypothetical protein